MKKSPVKFVALAGLLAVALTAVAVRNPPLAARSEKPTITVYKSPTCGCCKTWIEHVKKHGYQVDAKDTPDMAEIKRTLGVPDGLTSCHTAIVNGYLIEGHVPAADIDRLLAQKPKVAGLAVPGMPMGSPGMEGPTSQPYQVMSFDKSGKTAVFAKH
ncbi:MAG: DUF411 domain-containing protein [Gemmatimonadaceae bacterium]